MTTVTVNGARTEVDLGATVADVVQALDAAARRGVAVAVGGEVVPRGEWERRVLDDGERVEVVQAIQGG